MLPRKDIYLDVLAGWTAGDGVAVRGELGAKVSENVALFGFLQRDLIQTSAGVGARLTLDL